MTAVVTMTKDELRELVEEAVEETVTRTLTSLGMEPNQPKKMQADFIYIRSLRETSETVRKQALIIIVTLVISALAVLLGLKNYLGIGNP